MIRILELRYRGPPDPGGQHSDESTRSPLPVKAIRADYNVEHTPVYQAL
jgi:hypothetical protein